MLAVPYSLHPPNIPDQVIQAYQQQLAKGVTYYREQHPDSRDDPAVYACGVVHLKPYFYRAVILYARPQVSGSYIHACESSREDVTHWLTKHGLPTIRLIRADF